MFFRSADPAALQPPLYVGLPVEDFPGDPVTRRALAAMVHPVDAAGLEPEPGSELGEREEFAFVHRRGYLYGVVHVFQADMPVAGIAGFKHRIYVVEMWSCVSVAYACRRCSAVQPQAPDLA